MILKNLKLLVSLEWFLPLCHIDLCPDGRTKSPKTVTQRTEGGLNLNFSGASIWGAFFEYLLETYQTGLNPSLNSKIQVYN